MSEKTEKAIEAITNALKELTVNSQEKSLNSFRYVEFDSHDDSLNGKGLLWKGQGHTKQLIFAQNPDRFFSSESIELAKNKTVSINGIPVLTETELGSTIVSSNLRQVGRLKGLIVDGSVSIDQYLFYNSSAMRLGLGTEQPNAAFSIAEDGLEVVIGTTDSVNGKIGTYASHDFDIVTDNIPRITVSAGGNIKLGNRNSKPVEVNVHGKLAVGVNTIDSRVDLHVAGSIKFNERIHQYAVSPPQHGLHTKGDIVWNTNPEMGKNIGWVCVRDGSPGTWLPFGEIKPQLK
jgi:hypothetical protein